MAKTDRHGHKKSALRDLAFDTLADVLGSILYAIAIHTFASPAQFAPGGLTGISLILHHYFNFIPIGTCTLLLNLPIIALCYSTLGKKFLFKSLKTMVTSAVIMDFVVPYILPQYGGEGILAALFAGVLSGAGLAALYYRGSSSGGTDFIIFTLKSKFPQVSVGTITLFIDGIIILAGGLVFGNVDAVLFGIIMTFASSIIMDKLMYGLGSGKMTMIISNKGDEIAKSIAESVDRGSTIITARGTFSGDERQVLLCACSKREAIEVRSITKKTDPNAMLFLSTVDELYGLGFTDIQKQ